MIDYYEALNVKLDADADEIKKAFRNESKKCHPDKQGSSGLSPEAANERFNLIKQACDVLSDPERRKIYDTFGFDMGEERPESEVWRIGLDSMASPLGGFIMKTVILRLALWFVSFVWIGRLIMLLGLVAAGLFFMDIQIGEKNARHPELLGLWINVGIVLAIVFSQWLWPLLADGACVLYLISELPGQDALLQNLLVGGGLFLLSMFLAWLFVGRWWYVLGLEILLGIILLLSLTVASGIMRLWVDSVHTRTGDKLKETRTALRAEKKKLQDEAQGLRDKLRIAKLTADPDVVAAQRKTILEDQAKWEKIMKEQQSAKK